MFEEQFAEVMEGLPSKLVDKIPKHHRRMSSESEDGDEDEGPEVYPLETTIADLSFGKKSGLQDSSSFSTALQEPQQLDNAEITDEEPTSRRERELLSTINRLMKELKRIKEGQGRLLEPKA